MTATFSKTVDDAYRVAVNPQVTGVSAGFRLGKDYQWRSRLLYLAHEQPFHHWMPCLSARHQDNILNRAIR
jgi:hypothetical protein